MTVARLCESSTALQRSETDLTLQDQQTAVEVADLMSEAQGQMDLQAECIRRLNVLIVAEEARPRELTIAHTAAIGSMQEKIAVLERNILGVRQERDDTLQRIEQQAAAERAARAQTVAVENAQATSENQELALLRQEAASLRVEIDQQTAVDLVARDAAVFAATQAKRAEDERLFQLHPQETRDSCQMQRFYDEFIISTCWMNPGSRTAMDKHLMLLKIRVEGRLLLAFESVGDVTMQRADTEFLEAMDRFITGAPELNPADPKVKEATMKPRREVLLPLIAARKARGL